MEVGQAMQIANLEENIYRIAHTPIHTFIARLIPYLEQRQEVARRYISIDRRTDEIEQQYLALLEWNTKEISLILNSLPEKINAKP